MSCIRISTTVMKGAPQMNNPPKLDPKESPGDSPVLTVAIYTLTGVALLLLIVCFALR